MMGNGTENRNRTLAAKSQRKWNLNLLSVRQALRERKDQQGKPSNAQGRGRSPRDPTMFFCGGAQAKPQPVRWIFALEREAIRCCAM